MQSFVIVAYPSLLVAFQGVPGRFDFDQHEFLLPMNEEIWPSRIAAPVVLNEIAEDFHEGIGGHDLDQLPGNLDVFSPMRPQIVPEIATRPQPSIE